MQDSESKSLTKQIKRYAQVGGLVGKLATKLASQKYLGFKLVIFVVNCAYSFQSGVSKDFGVIEPV